MPLRSPKMNRFILGFQRRVWCPKCTPASSICRMVTTAMMVTPLSAVGGATLQAPRRPQKERDDVIRGPIGVDRPVGHVIGRRRDARPLRRRCAQPGRRRCPTRWRAVDRHEPRPVPAGRPGRSWDRWYSVAARAARSRTGRSWCRPVARPTTVAATATPSARQPAVGRRATVGLVDHHVAHAGDDAAER